MDADGESLSKISRRDDSRCVQCNIYIHKTTGRSKRIETREEAERISHAYQVFIQSEEVLCFKCYTKIRFKKSELGRSRSIASFLAEGQPSTSSMADQVCVEIDEMETHSEQESKEQDSGSIKDQSQKRNSSESQNQFSTSYTSSQSQTSSRDYFVADIDDSQILNSLNCGLIE